MSKQKSRRLDGPKKKQKNTFNKSTAVIALLTSLAVAGATFGYLYADGSLFNSSECELAVEDPILIMECLEQFCMFDTKQCQMNCPLGYDMDDKGCPKSCLCASSGLHQFDEKFTEDAVPELLEVCTCDQTYDPIDQSSRMGNFQLFSGTATSNKNKLWLAFKNDEGLVEIPYSLKSKFSSQYERQIKAALEEYKKVTCIRFVPYDKNNKLHKNWNLKFVMKRGCWSLMGKSKKYGQEVSIGQGCGRKGIVMHELMHAIGFQHEQMRPDRDSFVVIHKDRIKSGMLHNFKKSSKYKVKDLKSPYDITSIMHYDGLSFAKNKQQPTITSKKDGQRVKAQRNGFTEEDIKEINLLYDCDPPAPSAEWSKWGAWSEPGVTCGTAVLTRFRECQANQKPAKGCPGNKKEIRDKNLDNCPPTARGKWSDYTKWSECNKSCGKGYTFRSRNCIPDTAKCLGRPYEGKSCNTQSCSGSDCFWGGWSSWSKCSGRCGKRGFRYMGAECLSPERKRCIDCEGSDSSGKKFDVEQCIACQAQSAKSIQNTNTKYFGESSKVNSSAIGSNKFVKALDFPKLCENGDGNFLFVDFNQDGITDLLCSLSPTTFIQYHIDKGGSFTEVWKGIIIGCENPMIRFARDVNGDGKPDFICVHPEFNVIRVQLADYSGVLSKSTMYDLPIFCMDGRMYFPITGLLSYKLDFICRHKDFSSIVYFENNNAIV